MLGTESFPRRHFLQWSQKREVQITDAPSVLGTKSRMPSRDDTPHPTLRGSCGDPRTEGGTLEHGGAARDAKVKATENAAVRKTGDVGSKASWCASLPLHDCFGSGGLPRVPSLPHGYVLNASDPDVVLLLRADCTTAAVFSARGVTAHGILEAAGQNDRAANPSGNGTVHRVGRETVSARNGGRI